MSERSQLVRAIDESAIDLKVNARASSPLARRDRPSVGHRTHRACMRQFSRGRARMMAQLTEASREDKDFEGANVAKGNGLRTLSICWREPDAEVPLLNF